jgi:hypothetical protein
MVPCVSAWNAEIALAHQSISRRLYGRVSAEHRQHRHPCTSGVFAIERARVWGVWVLSTSPLSSSSSTRAGWIGRRRRRRRGRCAECRVHHGDACRGGGTLALPVAPTRTLTPTLTQGRALQGQRDGEAGSLPLSARELRPASRQAFCTPHTPPHAQPLECGSREAHTAHRRERRTYGQPHVRSARLERVVLLAPLY